MRKSSLLAIMAAFAALLPALHAQKRSYTAHISAGAPHGGRGFSQGIGLPPVGPIPPLGGAFEPGRHGRGRGAGAFGAGYFGYPFLWGDSGYDDGYYSQPYSASPSVVVVMPNAQPAPPAPPPAPARAEVREYSQPSQPQAGAAQAAAQPQGTGTFTIVGKDGRTREAIAVWVANGAVNYVSPDGEGVTLPLASVDRHATAAANARNGLTLRLPAS